MSTKKDVCREENKIA